jgi:hydrogenase maturation protease
VTHHRQPDHAIRVIVCGNEDRGDDAVGPVAVAKLLSTLPPDVLAALDLRHSMELRTEDLVDLPAMSVAVIVDAVAGVEPGRLVRLPLHALGDRPPFTPRSTHQLPIHLVVGLAGILRGQPIEGTFIGLGGCAFGYGAPLSRATRDALPAFRESIVRELVELVRREPRPETARMQEARA